MAENTISIILEANTAKFTSGIKSAERTLNSFGEKAKSTAKALGALSTAAAGIGTGFLTLSVKQFASFDQAMRDVQSICGATGEEFKRLADAARKMGRETAFSATEAANAEKQLAQAGFKTTEILASLEAMMKLAGATQFDLAQSAELVASTLSQFGLKAEESGRVANVFAAACANSQATMEKLAYSMRYIGPVAHNLGYSLEETVAALMGLYNAGYKGEQAGTILRGALNSLIKPSKDATETLEKLGVQVRDSSGHIRHLADIFGDLKEAGMTAQDAITIFGQEAGPGVMALVSQGSEALKAYQKEITGTSKAWEMYDVQMSGITGTWKKFTSALEDLKITFGEAVAPTLKKITDHITNLVNAFNKLSDSQKQSIVRATLVATAIAGIGGPMLLLIGYLPRVAEGFKSISSAMLRVGIPIAGIVASLAMLKASFSATTADVAKDAWWMAEEINKALLWLFKPITTLPEYMQDIILPGVRILTKALEENIAICHEQVEKYSKDTEGIFHKTGEVLKEWGAKAAGFAEEMFSKMVSQAEAAILKVDDLAKKIEGLPSEKTVDIKIKKSVEDAEAAGREVGEAVARGFSESTEGTFSVLGRDIGSDCGEAMSNELKTKAAEAGKNIESELAKALNTISNMLKQKSAEAGKNMEKELTKASNNTTAQMEKEFEEGGRESAAAFATAFGDEGQKRMVVVTKRFVKTLADGIRMGVQQIAGVGIFRYIEGEAEAAVRMFAERMNEYYSHVMNGMYMTYQEALRAVEYMYAEFGLKPYKGMTEEEYREWLKKVYYGPGYQSGAWYTSAGPAILHEGEMVLPRDVADRLREFFGWRGPSQTETKTASTKVELNIKELHINGVKDAQDLVEKLDEELAKRIIRGQSYLVHALS